MPRIDFAIACRRCAAPLLGMDSAGVCAACGHLVAETVDDRVLDAATGMVATDLTCVHCSYNLRTLRFDAACPECGMPVFNSLGVDELRFCDPRWLGRLRRGINIVLISVLASIVVGALGGLFAVIAGLGGVPSTTLRLILALPSISGYALVLIGAFYITSPKPDEPAGERTNRIGGIMRGLFLISFALTVVSVSIVNPFAMLTGGSISRWSFSLAMAQSLLYGVAAIGTLIVLARVAVLGRRPGLRKLGRVLAWCIGLQTLGQVATNIVTLFAWPAIAAGIPPSPWGSRTSTTVATGSWPVVTTLTVRSNTPGVYTPGATTTGAAGPSLPMAPSAAAVPGAGATPATPVAVMPMRPFAAFAVLGCFSGVVSIGAFVLGLTALVKYRNLLGTAIAASVTSARSQPLMQKYQ